MYVILSAWEWRCGYDILCQTIEEPESDELSETLLDEPILAIAVRIVVADKGDDESAALNVVVHGCYEASTTFGTTQKPSTQSPMPD